MWIRKFLALLVAKIYLESADIVTTKKEMIQCKTALNTHKDLHQCSHVKKYNKNNALCWRAKSCWAHIGYCSNVLHRCCVITCNIRSITSRSLRITFETGKILITSRFISCSANLESRVISILYFSMNSLVVTTSALVMAKLSTWETQKSPWYHTDISHFAVTA